MGFTPPFLAYLPPEEVQHPVWFLACQKIVGLTCLTFTWDLEER